MKADFSGALAFVLQEEGGYSDDSADPGGETNMGIENREYGSWLQAQKLPVVDVKEITVEQAGQIYRKNYWDAVHGDDLAPGTAYAMFDTAVNNGVGEAIKFMQGCLGVPETCAFDTATSDAYHKYISEHGDAGLESGILDRRVVRYRQLVAERSTLEKFLPGWLGRVSRLRTVIAKLYAV